MTVDLEIDPIEIVQLPREVKYRLHELRSICIRHWRRHFVELANIVRAGRPTRQS